MEGRRIEHLVGFLKWDVVNSGPLILDQNTYCDIQKRAKCIQNVELVKPTVEEDFHCNDCLKEKEREKECEEEIKEKARLEIDYEWVKERAEARRKAIEEGKEILMRDFHENKIFSRAIALVDMLNHNAEQAKENKNIEEEIKARYYQQDIRFMKGEQKKDTERKDKARKLRMDVNDDNIRLTKINLERKKKFDVEERRRAEEILCLTKEFLEEEEKKKTKTYEKRRELDEANKLEIERKEKLRQFNIKLDATEDREAKIFLAAKKKMYKDMTHDSAAQALLRQKRFDLVVEKTKEWILDMGPEAVRDTWYADVYTRECMAKQKAEVIDVKKRKDAYMNLVKAWDEQVAYKLKDRCEEQLEAKLCVEVRRQMDCDMKQEDEEKKYKNRTTALADEAYNKKLHEEKKNAEKFEKQYDKEHERRSYDWMEAQEKEQAEKKEKLIDKYENKGLNTIPLKKLNLKK